MFHTFSVALAAILSVFSIMGVGILLRRSERVPLATDHGLLRLTIDLLLPCLIFDRVLKTTAFNDPQNLWLPPLLGFGLVTLGIALGFSVGLFRSSVTGLVTWKQKRTFAACVGLLNYGYVPIPIVMALFPHDDKTLGVLFVQYLGAEIAVWTIVIFSMMGKLDRNSWKHLINGPILAILIAVPLNLLGNSQYIPTAFHEHVAPCFDFLLKAIHDLGLAGIPVSLLMVGLSMTEFVHREEIKRRWKTTLKTAFWSCLIRLAAMPIIYITLAVFLPCTIEIKRVLVVHGAMGSAIFPIVLSRQYNGNTETAFDTIMSNTLISVFTLPIWIALGLYLIR